jgi:hypothetical protein
VRFVRKPDGGFARASGLDAINWKNALLECPSDYIGRATMNLAGA